MMQVLTEVDLKISVPDNAVGRKFDDESKHGLSHCMKAVDFIVEFEDHIVFIEFKDPENPCANAKDSTQFVKKFQSGTIDADLKTKYRDSWLYEWAEGRATKPIYYYVLIAASTLSSADLLTRTDALKRQIPFCGPKGRAWVNSFIVGCAVMNIATWNKVLSHMPVSRVHL